MKKADGKRANLSNSTILMFKDIYRYGKRMSRSDYWWGILGLGIILIFDFLVLAILGEKT